MKEFFTRLNKQQMRSSLAILNLIGVFALIGFLVIRGVPAANKDMVYMAVGLLLGSYTGIMSYYFGSSKNETDKQKAETEKDA